VSLLAAANNGVNTPWRLQGVRFTGCVMSKSNHSQTGEPAGMRHQLKQNPPQRRLDFSSRRLLTWNSSVTVNSCLGDREAETLTIRATMMTAIMKNIPGYGYPGLND
jgi:hypothetical protein